MDGNFDVRIAELAARQHGVVSRRQLIADGATGAMIDQRLAIRRLRLVHAGVYVVGHGLSLRGRYLAAVFAGGEDSALSHRSAGAMFDLRHAPSGRIDVTTPRRGTHRRPGIALHVTRSFPPEDVVVRDLIPCTSIARTLVDLAGVAGGHELRRALEQSVALGLFDARALDAVCARLRGRRGLRLLRQLVADLPDDPPLLRSELERRFLELVEGAGLPAPVVNGRIGDYEVDFNWPAQRLIVETDGRATHGNAIAFERDRGRDLELGLAGWTVIRITWSQLIRRPDRITAALWRHLR
jgi:hypothetical protein